MPMTDHVRTICERAWQLRWRNSDLSDRAVSPFLDGISARAEARIVAASNAIWRGGLAEAEALVDAAWPDMPVGDTAWYCRAVIGRATVYYSTGRRDAAADLLHDALERVDPETMPDCHVELQYLLATTHVLSLDYDRALEILADIYAFAKPRGMIAFVTMIEGTFGRFLLRKGEFATSEYWTQLAWDSQTQRRIGVLAPYFKEVWGDICLSTGRVHQAIEHLEEGLGLARARGDNRSSCQILAVLGRSWEAAGLSERALAVLDQGQAIADQIDYPLWQRRFRLAKAETYEKMGDMGAALQAFKAFVEIDRSLFNLETERRLIEMRSSFELSEAQKVAEAERARSAELNRARAEAERLAWTDTLTGLRNRHALISDLSEHLERAGANVMVLMLLDLDRFKQVNDTYGHEAGDAVLVAVAERMTCILADRGTGYRLGGDEFAVILNPGLPLDAAEAIAARLIPAIEESVDYDGRGLFVGTSIGLATNLQNVGDGAELLRLADVALYEAKNAGRGQACLYRAEVDQRIRAERELETDLRHALERDEFRLFWQPIVDGARHEMIAAEGLLRWQHPRLGFLQPAQFIHILERGDAVFSVGEWVLRQGWALLSDLHDHDPDRKLQLSLNVSVRQFFDTGFITILEDMAQEAPDLPGRLQLEITESMMIQNMQQAVALLDRVNALGFRLCIDDFGTGFSSIAQLAQLPVQALKIDGGFLTDLDRERDAATLVRSIINLGQNLGLEVTAEGVETSDQAQFLRDNGCDRLQGYAFGRPMAWEALLAL